MLGVHRSEQKCLVAESGDDSQKCHVVTFTYISLVKVSHRNKTNINRVGKILYCLLYRRSCKLL